MAADFVTAPRPDLPHHLLLPASATGGGSSLEEVLHGLGATSQRGPVVLSCRSWALTVPELLDLQRALAEAGLELCRVEGEAGETLVAAAALGLPTQLQRTADAVVGETTPNAATAIATPRQRPEALTIHRGTLRSGDHLQVEGSVLLLGDVNPGARVSAGGRVLVWGRLRGVAHAGCHGDHSATITALQLRPLQLRIAEAVARGPQDTPPVGYTETALLVDGEITIEPAEPIWPFSGG